jgi:hypothetical protein
MSNMLQKFWKKWLRFGEILGNLFARIILTIFYFTIFIPFAGVALLFEDRLHVKKVPSSFWHLRENRVDTLESARGQ